ncbi:hypothetical protein FNV43_RR00387 [Rhamnella rubrinervis]|uniref:RNase H type-1 domain-containing protein n=1 Tax=Rhamnella rubrinervis TaxID=2594499 RepID=A0A8K0HQ97_9ROSA|nr:hypothetical protein FNV43_RR00387 [Rhamnella rubrinervis]
MKPTSLRDEDLLLILFEPDLVEAIKRLHWPRFNCSDKLMWIANRKGLFFVKECYLATFYEEHKALEDNFWDKLWKAKLHDRHKVFLWRLASRVLPLNQSVANVKDLTGLCVDPPIWACTYGLGKEYLTTILACLFYYTWRFRNKVVHGGKRQLMDYVSILNEMTTEFLNNMKQGSSTGCQEIIKEKWIPPTSGWFKINIDAAYKDGKAALALVKLDELGRVMYLAFKLASASTHFEAEIKAIEWAFEIAVEKNWKNIIWSSNALTAMKELLSPSDPISWETRRMCHECTTADQTQLLLHGVNNLCPQSNIASAESRTQADELKQGNVIIKYIVQNECIKR